MINMYYEIINNNYNLFLHVLQVLRHEIHVSYNAFIAFNALNSICTLYILNINPARHKCCTTNPKQVGYNKLNKEYESKALVFCYTICFTIPLHACITK